MKHDAAHCSDYVKGVCPMNCHRAELTEDLKNGREIGVPVSWASFIYSEECAFRTLPNDHFPLYQARTREVPKKSIKEE